MISFIPKAVALLSAGLTLLSLGGCEVNNPAEPAPVSPLIGTWILMKQGGADVSSLQYSYTFTETGLTFAAEEGCEITASYLLSGSELTSTVESDQCYSGPAGATSVMTFSIAGDQLSLNGRADTLLLKKGTPYPTYLSGKWNVTSRDGLPLDSLESVTLTFSQSRIDVRHIDAITCMESFNYWKGLPGSLSLRLIADKCNNRPVNEASSAPYSINHNVLTIVINDAAYSAERM
jgi:hypothetical protein